MLGGLGMALKRTPLHSLHAKAGARMIAFGEWELPVQFSGILAEHEAVRTRAGLFDASHMGELLVEGPGAFAVLQRMASNDLAGMADGQARYSPLCSEDGGTVDDVLIYRLAEDRYLLVVNAANVAKDLAWLRSHAAQGGEVRVTDVSDGTGLIALQGPKAQHILQRVTDAPVGALKPFRFLREAAVAGCPVAIVSRTGYTGEDGFELIADAAALPRLWEALLAAGGEAGLVPVGLGARDTLRLEAGLPLYGQELSPGISPLEAGLGRFVKWDKGDFVGRAALKKQADEGVPRRIVGLEMTERGIPRTGYGVYAPDGRRIGRVTSGTQSPTTKRNIGLALVDAAFAAAGTPVAVEMRGKRPGAVVVDIPFVKRSQR